MMTDDINPPPPPTGQQILDLTQAIIEGYDSDALEIMLRTQLDQRLDEITERSNFRKKTFDVVMHYAARQGGFEQLARTAYEVNPGNRYLQSFYRLIDGQQFSALKSSDILYIQAIHLINELVGSLTLNSLENQKAVSAYLLTFLVIATFVALNIGGIFSLFRGLTAWAAQKTVGVQFFINFSVGVLLGVSISIGIVFREFAADVYIDHRIARNRSNAAIILTSLSFSIANVCIQLLLSDLHISIRDVVLGGLMAFLAGLFLSVAIISYIESGSDNIWKRAGRIGLAGFGFAMVQMLYIALRPGSLLDYRSSADSALTIIWSARFYLARSCEFMNVQCQDLWLAILRLESAAVGIILYWGSVRGYRIASRWLSRYKIEESGAAE